MEGGKGGGRVSYYYIPDHPQPNEKEYFLIARSYELGGKIPREEGKQVGRYLPHPHTDLSRTRAGMGNRGP